MDELGDGRVVAAALERARPHRADPVALLRTVGSADLAAATAFLGRAAERGVPVLLDGVVSGACSLLAERRAPGAVAWWYAGHRSTEPAQQVASLPVEEQQVRMRAAKKTTEMKEDQLGQLAKEKLAELDVPTENDE